MAKDFDAPVGLYVAAYPDADAARADWDAILQLADDDEIKVEGLFLAVAARTTRPTLATTSTRPATGPRWVRSGERP